MRRYLLNIAGGALLALILVGGALAVAPNAFRLDWHTAGAGGTSSGGGFSLDGTAGQADAGTLGGGTFRLDGGFWGGSAAPSRPVYLPLMQR